MLLYVARDAQLLTEAIAPALDRGDVVFADRYLYSYEVLGADGRGLPRDQVRAVLRAVAATCGQIWSCCVTSMCTLRVVGAKRASSRRTHTARTTSRAAAVARALAASGSITGSAAAT